jgi:hypothetical protein
MRRSRLARDLIVFQGKLLLDAFKDLLLGPLTVVTALLGLVRPRPKSELLFYRVLEQGRAAEHAIDLFSAVERRDNDEAHWTVDTVIRQVETRLAGAPSTAGADASATREEERPPRQATETGKDQ